MSIKNIELYKSNNPKMDKYGYILQEIDMESSYNESFLVYKYIDLENIKTEIAIPTVNEVVIKNKNIVRTSISLMKLFPNDILTILSQIPDLVVASNEAKFRKVSDSDEYRALLEEKIKKHQAFLSSTINFNV